MASQKIKEVIIFGSNGDTAQSVNKLFLKNNWSTILVSRKKRSKKNNHYCCNSEKIGNIQKVLKQILKKHKNINCVINCIGFWQKTDNNKWNTGIFSTNLTIADNIFKSTLKFFQTNKPLRFITISSLDSIYLNTNAFEYSSAKSALRTLCKLYQKKYRKSKINFDLITPGAINSRQRNHKKENKFNLIQCDQLAEICFLVANSNYNLSYEEIILRPKTFNYLV